jgi:molybdate transport system substrate-binding protein
MKPGVVKFVALAGALALVAGCSSSKSSSGSKLSGSITVFAASSLTGTFTQLGAEFEKAHPGTTVKFDFGSSGDLATQIDQGSAADVFASAAPKNMQTVISAGNAKSSQNFVKNIAEIAAAPGNPAGIASLADLAKSGVKVALCVPTAPCGVLAQTVLKNAGVSVTPAASEPDVKSTLAIVETKEVDAGIVYVTDVKAAGAKVVGVPIPAAQNGTTEYPIAALAHSKNSTLAAAFVSYIQSSVGQQVLTAAGFQAP